MLCNALTYLDIPITVHSGDKQHPYDDSPLVASQLGTAAMPCAAEETWALRAGDGNEPAGNESTAAKVEALPCRRSQSPGGRVGVGRPRNWEPLCS